MGNPSRTIATKKPPVHATARRVRRRATSGGTSSESLKSAAAAALALPNRSQRISAAARENSGIEITSGKSFAFSGQATALMIPHAVRTRIAPASASEAFLALSTAAPPRLQDRVADHPDGDRQEQQHDRPRQPGGV